MPKILIFLLILTLVSCVKESEPVRVALSESSSPVQFSDDFKFVRGRPFQNKYTRNRGMASEYLYEFNSIICPDGRSARFRLITPTGWGDSTPSELTFIFHGGIYENARSENGASVIISSSNRLSAIWAHHTVEGFIGSALVNVGSGDGSIISALLNAGIASVILQNCWADMGYSRSYGPHRNNPTLESFSRMGLEAAELILNEIHGHPRISSIYAWGVSSGSQAALHLLDSNKTKVDKIVLDSPADYNLGLYESVDNLVSSARISSSIANAIKLTFDSYFYPVFNASSSTTLTPLEVNSLKYKLANDPDYLTKDYYYLYSNQDPAIPVEVSGPAAVEMQAIQTSTPVIADQFCIKQNSSLKHVQSNDDIELATRIVKFLQERTCT